MGSLFRQTVSVLSLLAPNAQAADFGVLHGQPEAVAIVGNIVSGDFERFREFLLRPGNLHRFFDEVVLDSNGGDVVEALKFASLFERAHIRVNVVRRCYSSCFIIYAAAAQRGFTGIGEIGVHRISLRDRSADIEAAKSLVSPTARNVADYLLSQGIPRALVDKMNETPASSLYRVDHYTAERNGWTAALDSNPVVADLTEKLCGINPDPYPGKFVRDAPRDAETMARIVPWVHCVDRVLNENRVAFMNRELAAVEAGRPSVLFPKGKAREARAAVQ